MKKVLFYSVVLLLWGCAQQVAPTGGPKDVDPPKILAEEPANLSTHFAATEIVISFDEFIQLKTPTEQVVISPPMLQPPTYQLKKKSLVVSFEQALAPNTTYTINFGKAIVDNNEGNVLENYTYVFSTGAHLDSMQVKGKVLDAVTGEPEKDALVMLYKDNIHSLPRDTVPDYFTRSLEDGSFLISNVANQPYKIFALKDENANYRFDVSEEKIGFLDTLILPYAPQPLAVADSSTTDTTATPDTTQTLHKIKARATPSAHYTMRMFVESDTTQFLKKSYCEHVGKLVFIYNRPVQDLQIAMQGSPLKKEWMLKEYGVFGDTITVWTTAPVPDTLHLLLDVGTPTKDTVELVMKPRSEEVEIIGAAAGKGMRKKSSKKFALTAAFKPSKNRAPKPNAPLVLEWNHPVIGMELSRIKLYEDSMRVRFDITTTDPALRKFDISYPWKKGKNYHLLVSDSAFTDIYQLWNDTTETRFTATDKEAFGELSLKLLAHPKHPIIVELLSASNAVLQQQQVSQKGTVTFAKLTPGKYHLRTITDLNANGQWDSGLYAENQQPEPIEVIQKDAEVRANWNMELEWNPTDNH